MTLADRSYESVYGEKYTVKINNLSNQITKNVSGNDTFRVINIEAGLGKSVETNRIVREYLESYEFTGENRGEQSRKFLIVKRFSKDVIDAENKIGKWLNTDKRKKVVGITGGNWSGDWQLKHDELVDADVIIITHARYVLLCSKEEERNVFSQERHTLIIDERIDFTKYSFSKKKYDEMLKILPTGLHGNLVDVARPLFNEMERVKLEKDMKTGVLLFNKQIIKTDKPSRKHIRHLNTFKSAIGENLPNILIEKGQESANKVREFTNVLEVLYAENGFFNNDTITSCNHLENLWSLDNNIILDANGSIDKLYKSDEKWKTKFILDRQTLIVDHSKSTFTHISFNPSKRNIKKLDKGVDNEYFSQIVNLIKGEHAKNQRLLIVMQKQFILDGAGEGSFVSYLRKKGIHDIFIGAEDDTQKHSGEKIAINWFGNLIGKNDWRDFDQCWILGTPNVPMETHVVNMAQYSKKYDWRLGTEMIRRGIDKYVFKNEVYEEIRKGYLIGEIYQAIKRIQRNAEPKAKFFVVSNDDNVIKGVVGLLKNIKVDEPVTLSVGKKEKKEVEKKLPTESEITMKILAYVLNRPKGEYLKGQLCETVGVENSNLTKYFNKNMSVVKPYIDSGEIAIGHHKIMRL
jgi:hypothetical protein